jgi:hypothetical protein
MSKSELKESPEIWYEQQLEQLESKIKILSQSFLWEGSRVEQRLHDWSSNFKGEVRDEETEILNAMYLLSQFMFFGENTIRDFLKAIHRDLLIKPLVAKIRQNHDMTTDMNKVQEELGTELSFTRFVPIGKISESGAHIAYLYRQVNELEASNFIFHQDIFSNETTLKFPEIKRYVFLDDISGTGSQMSNFIRKENIRLIQKINSEIELLYFPIFATTDAIECVVKSSFNQILVKPLFELDESYKVFSKKSRYFPEQLKNEKVFRLMSKHIFNKYALNLGFTKEQALGYGQSQLLIGFSHNTPDNTLPLFWNDKQWYPIFKRYTKK